jgi:hypothetical protein
MINHYRTLFLNLSDQGDPNEYIAPGFNSLSLPSELQNFYNLIYPLNSSRYYKQFIAYYCENLLHASGQTQYLTSFDSRITYDLSDLGTYFSLAQNSNPSTTDSAFSLLVTGYYNLTSSLNTFYDNFVITQLGASNQVTVYSTVQNLYLKGSLTSQSSAGMGINLTFTNNTSNLIPIGQTGISISISGIGANFGNNPNKQWSFLAQAPFQFDFPSFYNNFLNSSIAVDNMIEYGTATDSSSLNLWRQHFNTVYRLSGLLNLYTLKVNSLSLVL